MDTDDRKFVLTVLTLVDERKGPKAGLLTAVHGPFDTVDEALKFRMVKGFSLEPDFYQSDAVPLENPKEKAR